MHTYRLETRCSDFLCPVRLYSFIGLLKQCAAVMEEPSWTEPGGSCGLLRTRATQVVRTVRGYAESDSAGISKAILHRRNGL